MNIQELRGNNLNAFFFTLRPQLFGNCSAQTDVDTQQGEKDRLVCAVVQYGFNTVLRLKKTFLIMEGLPQGDSAVTNLALIRNF